MDPIPRLTCQQCKRRKIRCDKRVPCSACESANLSCKAVQRSRLPRGRSGKAPRKETLLETRVARIEKLLKQQQQIQPEGGVNQSSGAWHHAPTQSGCSDRPSDTTDKFVAPEFWSDLSNEVQGLRETLEGSESEIEDEDENENSPEGDEAGASVAAMIFQHNHFSSQNRAPLVPPPQVRTRLLDLYRCRVDNVNKVLHWPTALAEINAHHAGTSDGPTPLAKQALEFSIYFMALCSVTDDEAEGMGLGNRRELIQAYQRITEELLAKANLFLDPGVTVLQAFVIYLTGLRTCLHNGLTWTLVAVAVRAATALRLGDEHPGTFSAFDMELRRRLLFAIGILDTHAALDRGTVPIMPSTAFKKPPLSINDDDMSPLLVPSISSLGFTDMSYTVMIHEAMICQRKVYEISCQTDVGWENWSKKLDIVSKFEQAMHQKNAHINDFASPLERFQKFSAEKLPLNMQLMLRRPPYRQPPNAVPPWDDFDTMEVATSILQDHLRMASVDFAPWAWKSWVQWTALAVVLAELCGRSQGAASDRAYAIATESFRHFSRVIADTKSGMLWKPIARLMRRVQRVRQRRSRKLSEGSPKLHLGVSADPINTSGQSDIPFLDGPDDLLALESLDGPMATYHLLDSNNWSLDNDGSNSLHGTGSETWSQLHGSESGNATPWMNWDLFLQDVNLPAS